MDMARRVTVVAPAGSPLGVAMHAVLAIRGWSATLVAGIPGQPPNGTAEESPRPAVLIVVGDDGVPAHAPTASTESSALVCVGSVDCLNVLIRFANQGATVLNQAAPFPVLVRAVEDALLSPAENRAVANQVDLLLLRQAEAAALGTLTAAEEDALRSLMAGLTAAQIAAESHRSVNTVRSQIKAVLRKLGVQTQLTAVAIAHRSTPAEWLNEALVRFHQFW